MYVCTIVYHYYKRGSQLYNIKHNEKDCVITFSEKTLKKYFKPHPTRDTYELRVFQC